MTDDLILNELRSQKNFWLNELAKHRHLVSECESQVSMYARLVAVMEEKVLEGLA